MGASIVFMGTPEFAVPSLRALIGAGYPVAGVFTQPDRPSGRGNVLTPPPVKVLAQAHGLPVFQPERLRNNAEAHDTLASLAPELVVVVAYGQILPEPILALPARGCLNVHASLLPAWRGAAPISWAILNGDRQTGVTTMVMEKGLDTGPMLLQRSVDIGPHETADELSVRLSELGAQLLLETLPGWLAGTLTPTPQDEARASYASMLRKSMAPIDWAQGAQAIANRVRALHPWPGTTTVFEGQTLKVLEANALELRCDQAPGTLLAVGEPGWDVAAGSGVVRVKTVQLPGKKPQDAAAVSRGWRALAPGIVFAPPGS